MASMKQIKKRKKSVDSTGKITKAMKLVASVKLQKTKQIATDAIPYIGALYDAIIDILNRSKNVKHKYLTGKIDAKKAVVVISSNKGLAGSYNFNVIKKVTREAEPFNFDVKDTLIYAIGSKAKDILKSKNYVIEKDYSFVIDDLHYASCKDITEELLNDFVNGKINEIYLVYTFFKNTITHIPIIYKLLPFNDVLDEINEKSELTKKSDFKVHKSQFEKDIPMNYDIDDEEMLNEIIPKYITTIIHGAITASIASENGARMTAMDNATKNAKELSEKLDTMYNRARQGAITQELTEIVGGANAIN